MSAPIRNQAKIALRKTIKELLGTVSKENRDAQSKTITEKVKLSKFSIFFCKNL